MNTPAQQGRHGANGVWHLDVSYPSDHEQRFSVLCIVEHFSHACLALEIQEAFHGPDVVRVLERLASAWSAPDVLMVDKSILLEDLTIVSWATHHGTRIVHPSARAPCAKGLIERAIRSAGERRRLPGYTKASRQEPHDP